MKMAPLNFLLFIIATLTYCCNIVAATPIDFERWMALHEKSYSSTGEYNLRLKIWLENKDIVERHNNAFAEGLTLYTMTMKSPFADMTADEFSELYLMEEQHCSATTHTSSGRLRPHQKGEEDDYDDDDFVDDTNIDWRTKGIMTPVKNQGNCGSCWTFSTTGCLEAHACLAHYNSKWDRGQDSFDCTKWHGLAEQQLIDCAGDFNNFGCDGGLPSQAFEYIKSNGGIDWEDTYAYQGKDSPICQAESGIIGAEVAAVYNITSEDEDDLIHAVATLGPVSIAYDVSPDFRFYEHGVYDSYNATTDTIMCNSTNFDVNHAVVAVGLGRTEDHVPYYIVRNSWGTNWGMEGHFWMKRGENLCGVSDCASFPLVPEVNTRMEEASKDLSSFLRGASDA